MAKEYSEEEKQHLEELKSHTLEYLNEQSYYQPNKNGFFHCVDPEHIDSNPSMRFNPKNNTCKCFACGKVYDIFALVKNDYDLKNFGEAFRKVEELYGDKGMATSTINNKSSSDFNIDNYLSFNKYYALDYMRSRGINDFLTTQSSIRFNKKKNSVLIPIISENPVNQVFTSYTERFIGVEDTTNEEVRYKHIGGSFLYNPLTPSCDHLFIVEGEIDALSIAQGLGWGKDSKGNNLNIKSFEKNDLWNTNKLKQIYYPLGSPTYNDELDAKPYSILKAKPIGLGSANNTNLLINAIKKKKLISKKLIIALDNDKAGARGTEALIEGLKDTSCKYIVVNLYGKYKDANEALLKDKEAFEKKLEFVSMNFDKIYNKEIKFEDVFPEEEIQDEKKSVESVKTITPKEDEDMALNKKDENLTKLVSEIVSFYKKTNPYYNLKNESEEKVDKNFTTKITKSLMYGDIGYIKNYIKRYIENKTVSNKTVERQTRADALSIVEGLEKLSEKKKELEIKEGFNGSSDALKEFLSAGNNITPELMKSVVIENYKNMLRNSSEELKTQRLEYLIFKSNTDYNHFSELNKDLLYAQCKAQGFIPLCDNYNEMQKRNLHIKKGSKAMIIVYPIHQKYYFKDDQILPPTFDKNELLEREEKVKNGEYTTKEKIDFRMKACEFSISQTDIKEEDKPKIYQRFVDKLSPEQEQETHKKYEALWNLVKAIGYPIKETDFNGNEALGTSAKIWTSSGDIYKGVIEINKDQPIDKKFGVLAHELGHSLFHKIEDKIYSQYRYTSDDKEVQAEQFSNMVCAAADVLTQETYSEQYLASYLNCQTEEQLNECAERLYGHTRVVEPFQKIVSEGIQAYLNNDKEAFDNCVNQIKESSAKRFYFNDEKETGIVVKEENVSIDHTNTTIADVVKFNENILEYNSPLDKPLKPKPLTINNEAEIGMTKEMSMQ